MFVSLDGVILRTEPYFTLGRGESQTLSYLDKFVYVQAQGVSRIHMQIKEEQHNLFLCFVGQNQTRIDYTDARGEHQHVFEKQEKKPQVSFSVISQQNSFCIEDWRSCRLILVTKQAETVVVDLFRSYESLLENTFKKRVIIIESLFGNVSDAKTLLQKEFETLLCASYCGQRELSSCFVNLHNFVDLLYKTPKLRALQANYNGFEVKFATFEPKLQSMDRSLTFNAFNVYVVAEGALFALKESKGAEINLLVQNSPKYNVDLPQTASILNPALTTYQISADEFFLMLLFNDTSSLSDFQPMTQNETQQFSSILSQPVKSAAETPILSVPSIQTVKKPASSKLMLVDLEDSEDILGLAPKITKPAIEAPPADEDTDDPFHCVVRSMPIQIELPSKDNGQEFRSKLSQFQMSAKIEPEKSAPPAPELKEPPILISRSELLQEAIIEPSVPLTVTVNGRAIAAGAHLCIQSALAQINCNSFQFEVEFTRQNATFSMTREEFFGTK